MSIQAVAIETLDPSGRPVRGVVGKLQRADGLLDLLVVITNDDGYDLFTQVPVPFVGNLILQALDGSGRVYRQAVSIPDAPDVTLRVGGAQVNPNDQLLPACVPFA